MLHTFVRLHHQQLGWQRYFIINVVLLLLQARGQARGHESPKRCHTHPSPFQGLLGVDKGVSCQT